jgi:hypothetical protein
MNLQQRLRTRAAVCAATNARPWLAQRHLRCNLRPRKPTPQKKLASVLHDASPLSPALGFFRLVLGVCRVDDVVESGGVSGQPVLAYRSARARPRTRRRSTATRGSSRVFVAVPPQRPRSAYQRDDGAATATDRRTPRLPVPRLLQQRPHLRDRVLQHLMARPHPGGRPVDKRGGRRPGLRV